MTTNEKRIKIAEACGWLDITRCTRRFKPAEDGVCVMGTKDPPSINYAREYSFLPDYFNDLNAMHEAENVLTIGQQITFQDSLIALHNFGQGTPVGFAFRITHSTAAQRAEAFGKTLNLW